MPCQNSGANVSPDRAQDLKILVDCVPLTVGGGVQVAIGTLVGLQKQSAVDWAAAVPSGLRVAFPPDLAEDARIIYVNRRRQVDRAWLTLQLKQIEQRLRPDVVFTVFGPTFFRATAPHLVGFALPKLIYDPDVEMPPLTLSDRVGNWLRRCLFRRADHIVVETEVAKVRFADRIGFDLSRISVIPNCPNPLLERLPDLPVEPGAAFSILVPSAYYWHKNLEIVPHVAAAMRRRAPDLNFVFRFTLPKTAREWQRIQCDAQRLGVGESVATLGVLKITELANAYREASAVYLPTLREVSTAVYPESFLFARPLVTSNMDFARELCGAAAIFVSPRDPDEAAARLVDIASSPQLAARLVSAGKAQLSTAYPTAQAKFRMQMDLVAKIARHGRKIKTRRARNDPYD